MADKASRRCFELPPEKFRGKIPFIVTDLVKQLYSMGVEHTEGIFRLAGSEIRTRALVERLNMGPVTKWSAEDNIHDIATAFKRYFRNMAQKSPLIEFELYDCFICSIKLADDPSFNFVEAARQLIGSLGDARRKTLCYLCRFLSDLTKHHDENKMTAMNLAICIAPNILVSPENDKDPDQIRSDGLLANKVVERLIGQFDEIFCGFDVTDDDFCTEQDIEEVCAAKLNTEKMFFWVFRNKLRANSVIPYVPPCRIERKRMYERPRAKPVGEGIVSDENKTSIRRRLETILGSVSKRHLSTIDMAPYLQSTGEIVRSST